MQQVQQLLEDEQDTLSEIDQLEEDVAELQESLTKQKEINKSLMEQMKLLVAHS